MRLPALFLLTAACALATACNTTKPMQIDRPTDETVALDTETGRREALEPISFEANSEPLRYFKTTIAIRHGTNIIAFPPNVEGVDAFCNAVDFADDLGIAYAGSSGVMEGWSGKLGIIFYDVMRSAGYDLAGDPDQLFGVEEDKSRARYVVAGRIDSLKANICQKHHWYDARPLNEFAGEAQMSVTWAVQDLRSEEVVFEAQEDGYFHTDALVRGGYQHILDGAFADSAGRLARNQAFRTAVAKADPIQEVAAAQPVPDEPIYLPRLPLSDQRFQQRAERNLAATVTLFSANGHGSGVIVSTDGYILTNEHVVDQAEAMSVRLSNGLEVVGQVVRRHKNRDIALVKIPLNGLPAASITFERPGIGEDVFVIGTPAEQAFASTVTRGVYGGMRTIDMGIGVPMEWVRHDAAVIGGNSGGPIFDDSGNVIGLVSWGHGDYESLNFGVPIASGLDFLNVRLQGAEGS